MFGWMDEASRQKWLDMFRQFEQDEAVQAEIRRGTWSPERIRRFEEKRAWVRKTPRAALEEVWDDLEAERAQWSPEEWRCFEERWAKVRAGLGVVDEDEECGMVNKRRETVECWQCRERREEEERQEINKEEEEARQRERMRERVRMRVEEAKRELREEKEMVRMRVEEAKRELREQKEMEERLRRRRREEREQREMQETTEETETMTLIGSASAMRFARIQEWRAAAM